MGFTLLLTQSRDPTADYIQTAFEKKNLPIPRINLDDRNVPNFSLDPLKRDKGWIEDINGIKIKVEDIKAIIIRRPAIPNLHKDETKNRFLEREILFGLRAFLETTSAIWMNHPDSNSIASSNSTSETTEFRTQFPATPLSIHNRLANIHRNYLESTQLAQRHTTYQQNDRIPSRFPEKSHSS